MVGSPSLQTCTNTSAPSSLARGLAPFLRPALGCSCHTRMCLAAGRKPTMLARKLRAAASCCSVRE